MQGLARETALTMLKGNVKAYTKAVEAHVKALGKQGLKHRPQTTVEVGLLLVSQLETLNRTMLGISDMMRSSVSSPLPRSWNAP